MQKRHQTGPWNSLINLLFIFESYFNLIINLIILQLCVYERLFINPIRPIVTNGTIIKPAIRPSAKTTSFPPQSSPNRKERKVKDPKSASKVVTLLLFRLPEPSRFGAGGIRIRTSQWYWDIWRNSNAHRLMLLLVLFEDPCFNVLLFPRFIRRTSP